MHKFLKLNTLLIIVLALTALSCTKFRRIERSPDWRVKYEAGLRYYEEKEYYKASVLFEQIMPVIRGLPEGEKVQLYMAYCQYYQKLYLMASHQFRLFYETYGRSASAEESQFMYAYSLYMAAPPANLDQTSSKEAMNAMQLFLNRYPNSKYREQAINVIDVSQAKLEKKGFENAKQYYKIGMFKAAIIAFDNFKKEFPDSDYIEEAMYYRILSQFKLAEESIPAKQKERYNEVVSMYLSFIDSYPKSNLLRDAEKLYIESLSKITKF
ncbi:MAG TPA: outer membrane protein assembly factor BamD [Cyclobacteriaceae bacterium]|nr:outer membrane protein assembly factor BamD [Cyclobacteriaceae bacterium]